LLKKKNATIKLDFKNKINMSKIPNKVSSEGIETQFYEELCPITTLEFSTPTTPPHKTTQSHIQHQTISLNHHLNVNSLKYFASSIKS
jgi:hypothetical protein